MLKQTMSHHRPAAWLLAGAALFLTLPAPAGAQTADDPFAGLLSAERTFAADATRIGITPAFREHAASDSVLLAPEPVSAPEHLAKQVDTPGLTLEWQPAMAGIARSNDLGFTSGPYRMTRGGRMLTGQFLTIWLRGADGRWRWFLDHGLPPQAAAGAVSLPTQAIRFADAVPFAPGAVAGHGLDATEKALNTAFLDKGLAALLPVLAEDGYLLRPRSGPLVKAAAGGLAPATQVFIHAEQLGTRVSAAGDLAVSYGRFVPSTGAPSYYVRVWRRNGAAWQLLIDELV